MGIKFSFKNVSAAGVSKQNTANSSILNSLTLSVVSGAVNYTRVEFHHFLYCIFLFSFQGKFQTRRMKRTTRRVQVCTGWGFLHINFSLKVDVRRKIFRICCVKRGFLNSRCNSALPFTNVYLQTFTHSNFAVAWLASVIMSTVAMQQNKEQQKVIPQTVPKNYTKPKDIPALHHVHDGTIYIKGDALFSWGISMLS